jgi:hypothetical protein
LKLALVGDVNAKSNQRGVMLTDPHSWVMVEPFSYHNLSLKLDKSDEITWKPWAIQAVVAGPSAPGIERQLFHMVSLLSSAPSDPWPPTSLDTRRVAI